MQPKCSCPVCGSEIDELPLTILVERGMVIAGNRFVAVTGSEIMLLQRLADVFPRVLSKEAAMEWLYQMRPDEQPEIKIIDVYVCKLRKKLDAIGVRIDTVWGKGYALAVTAKPHVIKEAA